MANYTTTNLIINENKGDSIFHNNMQTSGSITITPNEGYVVCHLNNYSGFTN